MSEPFLGQIELFPYNFAPRGWAFCQGQLLSIQQNSALFSLLGTTYGGNGSTTFGLPDLRGRVAISAGQGPGLSNYVLGQVSGTENVTLNVNQIPAHTHQVAASTAKGSSNSPANAVPAAGGQYGPSANTTMAAGMVQPSGGGGQPVSIVQPYLTLQYCIALQGIFPSRN
jgi:microcystin-dependent protein